MKKQQKVQNTTNKKHLNTDIKVTCSITTGEGTPAQRKAWRQLWLKLLSEATR
jgi:hypothetical protein